MKKSYTVLMLAVIIIFYACNTRNQSVQNNILSIENQYLGQKRPGLTAEIFAPGVISLKGRYEHSVSFSPDLDEIYYTASIKDEETSIYYSKFKNRKWSTPKKANFTKGKKKEEMESFMNLKGDKIYFTAYDSIFGDEKIWYVDRLKDSWSTAKKLDSPINDDMVFYSNQAKNGDLYYFNISKRKTYYAPNKNGKFPEVHEVNVGGAHAFISPSQDYMVINARNKENAERKSDIYVYFKEKDGTWSKAINLGSEVNSNFIESCPSITPDGKYLFFGRYNDIGGVSDVYWASTEVIHKLKTAYFKK
jgi:Tol biopolymer transport system component